MTRTTRLFAFLPIASFVLASAFASDRKDGALPVPRLVAPQPGAERPRDEQSTRSDPRDAIVRYGRDVRPILSDKCFQCHGQDASKRAANLRLDRADEALAAREHGNALVPGDPSASLVWRRVTTTDADQRMPPADAHKPALTQRELDVLERWITQGAVYEPHWAFSAPTRSQPPVVANAAWPITPIDAFVLAHLEREGIAPSPDADRVTLARRAFLDVTGLPPTPAELDQFLADERTDAFERLLERLLHEEPYVSRYAERMASPWLDQARYADTSGIHTDAGRQMWAWRDWVLHAFRDGMTFDRFLTEQLAGDLIPGATREQLVASGFNRNHVTTDEGGAIAEEYLVEYAVDRVATTGSVFLGLTLGCARCHDHKFDPISQPEFYGLMSFFNSIEEPGLYSQLPDPNRAFEPFIEVPSAEQERVLADLTARRDDKQRVLDDAAPEEAVERVSFVNAVRAASGVSTQPSSVVGAVSTGGATLTVRDDGSVFASGANPDQDEHVLTLHTDATDLRLVQLEVLPDPELPSGRVGRAFNGNGVLSGIEVVATSVVDPTRSMTVPLDWAWADFEQENGDFSVTHALRPDTVDGWAVDAHNRTDGRLAWFLAQQPFGFEGGTELRVRLVYRSIYAQHTFGRVRVGVARIDPAAFDMLPVAASTWHLVGPFPADSGELAFTTAFGPESETALDRGKNFGFGNQAWRPVAEFRDDRLNGNLQDGTNVSYVAKEFYVPSARKVDARLGSDDGFRLFLDGVEIAQNRTDRGLAPDQDAVSFDLPAGRHLLVLKVANSGGEAGFQWRTIRPERELRGELLAALVDSAAQDPHLVQRFERAWRTAFSTTYREGVANIAALDRELEQARAMVPRTMVMKERAMPRDTFVLMRGLYDKPDENQRVARDVPRALGAWPADAPRDRLGLARWLTAPDHPLVARVFVNRVWDQIFGTGLVKTTEDFGLQGEYPSHPELLDWLAVDFVEHGYDVKRLVTQILSSRVYRQSARVRDELRERDPDNRWLAYFPRKRLSAEAIRDQALYVAGLLVETVGGPSVRPYQPEGLWQEVAMPASNTRAYERGDGTELWRRSLYTYWKRAAPPPTLLALDAPTRESCTVKRTITNTPLQALALWNDEQFVEAARALAQRTLAEASDDAVRLESMFRRCTGSIPNARQSAALTAALADFRARYASAPQDAEALLTVGVAPRDPAADVAELAAWTMVASALLNLDATITRG
ncbi:MAG: PSD1 domain-containing protein [Planctomycetes bacterium]|nr:PSD1 domain-containing protein [Planctomycetota bacterium]